jgi:predicted small secreted protein
MIKKMLAVVLMLGLSGAITACNTMAGAGKDIQRGGEAVHDTANDVQKKM